MRELVRAADRERVDFMGREDWTGREQRHHATVTIRACNGGSLEKEAWREPMSRMGFERRYRELVEPRPRSEKAERALMQLRKLESAVSLRPLMQELRG